MTQDEITKFARDIGAMQSSIITQTESINQLSTDIKKYSNEQNQFAQECIKAHAINDKKASAAHSRLDDHDKQLGILVKWSREIDKLISPLVSTNKIAIFIGGGIGLSIIGLIWAIITGQVTLIFP